MTEQEFSQWGTTFFARFPSVNEWLLRSSPEPAETLKYWRKILEPYTLEECSAVLDLWAGNGSKAFAAYDRDNIPLVVKSTIDKQRQKRIDREQVDRERHYRRLGRSGDEAVAIVSTLDRLELKPAFLRLRPIHQKMLDGEITEAEYEQLKENITREL